MSATLTLAAIAAAAVRSGLDPVEVDAALRSIINRGAQPLRDQFAGLALSGELASQSEQTGHYNPEGFAILARRAYAMADAMLDVRAGITPAPKPEVVTTRIPPNEARPLIRALVEQIEHLTRWHDQLKPGDIAEATRIADQGRQAIA